MGGTGPPGQSACREGSGAGAPANRCEGSGR
ncbi:hypothetical protein chiPu_0029276, partial [Chiloscyllium punctatum]|nr:hypothetical protein [Chiloscyllium punctatum]